MFFNSSGGTLNDGIEIGKAIRFRSLHTAVVADQVCASACALAWLGGAVRLLDIRALVGFHAAYRQTDGIARETGSGNAIVGAYLTNLGLSEAAIILLTQKPPEELQFLTPDIARQFRIDVHFIDLNNPDAGPSFADRPSFAEQARSLVIENLATAGAASPSAYAAFMRRHYASEVIHFGERKNRERLIQESIEYKQRWPVLRYDVLGPLDVTCSSTLCLVEGTGRFQAQSPPRNAHSTGTFSFSYDIENRDGRPMIVATSGKVESRETSAALNGGSVARQLQSALAKLGCRPGPIDGVWGKASAAALVRFNRANAVMLPTRRPTQWALGSVTDTAARRCTNRRSMLNTR
ncbi:MAG: hypothetical protein AcusKO_20780 [Acuticoccus sp.]